VDLVVKGEPSRALMERLAELETERDATELAVAEAEIAALPMTFKPHAADDHCAKVKDLKAALASADAENRAVAYTAIRELTAPVNGPKSTSTAAFNSLLAKNEADTRSKGALVAGARNSHPLRLPPFVITLPLAPRHRRDRAR
jgi:hypothetical protein